MTRSILLALSLLLAASWLSAMGAGAAGFPSDDDFVVVSCPASPRVAYALQREKGRLAVVVEVESDGEATVALGLHGMATLVLSDKDAVVKRGEGAVRFTFSAPGDWSELRLGLAVAWAGGPFGQHRQRERFRHTGGAPHAPLSTNPSDWLPLDLAEHEALVADRRKRIAFDFEQPMDGHATIVLEDAAGQRVRNLLAGRPLAKGRHRIAWDGLDERGNVASPGTYRWRAISHPGVWPEYLFSFCNDGNPPWRTGSGTDMWGPDHSTLTAAAGGDEWTFLGGSCAESGYAMVAVDAAGVKRMHYNQVHGTGLWKIALAAGGRFLYAAHDGFAWGQHVDRKKPDWKASMGLTVTRFDVKSGQVVPFPGNQRFAVVSTLEVGPGSANPKWEGATLGGLAFLDGRLYVSNRASNAILVLEAETAKKVDAIPLDGPGALTAHAGRILAVSRNAIMRIDPASKKLESVAAGLGSPEGIAADAAGRLYVSDGESHTVRVLSAEGKPLRELGKPGGPYAGPYDPERMVNPRGLAVAPNGWLWVAEERWNPKRALAWDLKTGKVVKEKFGPTAYGASEAGFDEADPTRWIGQGAAWKLDFARKDATPTSILFQRPGHVGGYFKEAQYAFHRQDGRTFLLGLGGVTSISELRPDGTLHDLAFVGSTHRLCFACDWNPPVAFVEAFNAAYPNRKGKHADKGPGVLWVDSNGDGLCQADEFDFSTDCDNFAGGYWGHRLRDLTIRVPATVKGRRVLVTLEPQGFLPGGAPKYPKLNAACTAAKPVALETNELETAVDRFGRVVANSDPEMKCFAPDGRTLWAYPNRWTNVHGSHNAPLPETGVMQGALYFLGMARFDDQADIFVMNGNHGRFFALTSDGFYLAEMFKDVRMGASIDAYLIGGECFGGFFGRAATDGAYYLQSGHTDYRLFRLHGLAEARRSQGTVTVAPEQAIDIQTLTGDSIDNVRGIPGVGEKTAAKLLQKYGSIDGILAHVDELTPKLRQNVKASAEHLPRTRQLVTLRTDVPFEFDPAACRMMGLNAAGLRPHLQELGFTSLLARMACRSWSASANWGMPVGLPRLVTSSRLKPARISCSTHQSLARVEIVFSSCWNPSRTVISPNTTFFGYSIRFSLPFFPVSLLPQTIRISWGPSPLRKNEDPPALFGKCSDGLKQGEFIQNSKKSQEKAESKK